MPFTPFHLGPALFIGLLLFSILDMPSFLISSVAVDVEPLYLMFQGSPYIHGFFHSYLGASIIGVLVALIVYALRNVLHRILAAFRLPQKSSFKKTLFTSLFGVYFHVFLDSFLYTDIRPFYPLEIKPLYGVVQSRAIYLFCVVSFLLGFLLYIYRVIKGVSGGS